MSDDNELREKIANVLINDYGPTVTIVISDKSVDAILDAVIEALDNNLKHNADWSANRVGSRTKKWESEGYRRAMRDVTSILDAAKSPHRDQVKEGA